MTYNIAQPLTPSTTDFNRLSSVQALTENIDFEDQIRQEKYKNNKDSTCMQL
jgi:hypothetical protein